MTFERTISFLLLGASALAQAATPGVEALDWAYTFASAIDADPTDKGRAQQQALMDYPELGAIDRAVELAASVEGWRRGAVYADLAVELARDGQLDRARELIRRAEQVRLETAGWQAPRIEAHVAHALAYLGEVSQVQEITVRLSQADGRQYVGRAAATMAAARGTREGFEQAMKVLGTLAGADDLDTVWWRTMGFLELARDPRFGEGERRRALAAAQQSAADIQGWKQAEMTIWLSQEWVALDRGQARALLEQAEGTILALADAAPARGPMLAEIAASWAELGDTERTEQRLEQAMAAAQHVMSIEQPEVHGRIARSLSVAGDAGRAREEFDRALTLAEALVNSRPRALALSSILRSMAEAHVEIDEPLRARLVKIESGLGDPW